MIRLLVPLLFAFALIPPAARGDTTSVCDDGIRTQMCLLDRVMFAASQRGDVRNVATSLLEIARIAESAGNVPMDRFMALFIDRLEGREPYGASRLSALRGSACMSHGAELTGPILAAEMIRQLKSLEADVTAEDRRIFDDDLQVDDDIVACLVALNDIEGIDRLISQHPDRVEQIAIWAVWHLLQRDEFDAASALIERYGEEDWTSNPWLSRHWVKREGWRAELAAGDIAAVIRRIEALPDEPDQVRRVRMALAETQIPEHRARLQAVVQGIFDAQDGPLSNSMFSLMVKDAAAAGDWDTTLALIGRLEPSVDNFEVTRWALVRVAAASGVYDVVIEQMKSLAPDYRGSILQEEVRVVERALSTALAAGRTDISVLLNKLDGEVLASALARLGRIEVEAGSLVEAQILLKQATNAAPGTDRTKKLREEIALALAMSGQAMSALDLLGGTTNYARFARIAVHAPH
jgi:hypothetical protein